MPNKGWNELNPLDAVIRKTLPPGMFDGVHLTIEYFSGFEQFNTRPYHNYETWSSGYRIGGKGIVVEREDLDDAITAWVQKYNSLEVKPNEGEASKWIKWNSDGTRAYNAG